MQNKPNFQKPACFITASRQRTYAPFVPFVAIKNKPNQTQNIALALCPNSLFYQSLFVAKRQIACVIELLKLINSFTIIVWKIKWLISKTFTHSRFILFSNELNCEKLKGIKTDERKAC
jgi:hypothetical protein